MSQVYQFKVEDSSTQLQINHKGTWLNSSVFFYGFQRTHTNGIGFTAEDIQGVEVINTWRMGGEIKVIWKNGRIDIAEYGRSRTTSVKGVMDNRHRNWKRRNY